MTELPKAPVKRILANAGARRVSNNAVDAFVKALEKFTAELTKDAVKMAKRTGRKTIQKKDVLAARRA